MSELYQSVSSYLSNNQNFLQILEGLFSIFSQDLTMVCDKIGNDRTANRLVN